MDSTAGEREGTEIYGRMSRRGGIKGQDLVATGKGGKHPGLGRSIEVEPTSAIRFVSLPAARASCSLVVRPSRLPRCHVCSRIPGCWSLLSARLREGQWMPALDACSGTCDPPYEARWHPPASRGSWESRKHRMGRNSERPSCPLLAGGLRRGSCRRWEPELASDGQARGRPGVTHQ